MRIKCGDQNDIVYEGILEKKRYMYTQKRRFVLYANGNLSYYAIGESKEKNTLKVDKNMTIKRTGKSSFELECKGKKYPLSEVSKDVFTVDDWIENL